MARTIRRKNGERPYWLRTTWKPVDGIWMDVPKDEKTLIKDLARYHSDSDYKRGPSKWFRGQEHTKIKTLVKGELARFNKDPNYEVQVERRLLHDYWD